ncbi:hypothetical protein F5884DRAFT_850131 [Xylogone sp. PMI_703]|nr:hypothetical protein F5884DRAFT_850131 [Xylogone sp. PMI_703]
MVGFRQSLVTVAVVLHTVAHTVQAASVPASGFVSHNPAISFSLNIPDDSSEDLYFSLSGSTSYSYIAVGMGSDKMEGSLIFLLYTSSHGNSITLSPRVTDGHTEPTYTSKVEYTILDNSGINKVNKTMTVNAKCSNCRKWNSGSLNITSNAENFIYATGPPGSLKTNSESADTKRHNKYGTFQMDLTKAVGAAGVPALIVNSTVGTKQDSNTNDNDFPSALHGALMVLTFFGLMPLGVFLLRILERPRFHGWNMEISAAIAIIGTGFGIYSATMYNRSKNWNSGHQILGIIVILAMIGQFLLGFMHHRIYKRTLVPTKLAPYHRWLGRVVIPMGIVDAFLGFPFALNSKYDYVLIGVLVSVVIVMVLSVFWRTQRKARNRKFSGLSEEPSSIYQPQHSNINLREL